MSGNFVRTIKFTRDKTCGVQLTNFPLGHNLEQGSTIPTQTVVKVVADNLVTGYFGLSLLQQSNHLQKQDNHALFINGLYANKIGFQNDSNVSVEILHNVPACVQAYIEPVTIDDWEILELHADQVESSLLDQIRVIWPNQVFPLWVDKSICIFMRTVKIEPVLQCAVLIPLTELVVEPKVSERPYFVEDPNKNCLPSLEKDLEKIDVSASSCTPTDSMSRRQRLLERFVQLTVVRKFMKLIAYLMDLLWNRIVPSIRSSLAFFNFFSSNAMPVTASDEERCRTLRCIEDFPDNFDVVFRVEPVSERDIFNYKRCCNNVHRGERWNFVDETGALFCGEPRCVLMQTATAEDKYFKKPDKETALSDKGGAQNASENYKRSSVLCDPGYFIVSLQKLPSPSERNVKPGSIEKNNLSTSVDSDGGDEKTENAVRLCVHAFSRFAQIFKRKSDFSAFDTELHPLKISAQLRQQLRIGTSSRVRIKKIRPSKIETTKRIKKIVFQLLDDYSHRKCVTVERITYSLEQWLSLITDTDHPLPVTVGSILCIPWKLHALWDETHLEDRDKFLEDGISVGISDIETDSDKKIRSSQYFLLSYADLLNIELDLLPYDPTNAGMASLEEIDFDVPCESLTSLGSVHKNCLDSLLSHAENVLRTKPLSNKLPGKGSIMQPGCILVTGPRGVGKSTLCHAVLRKLAFSAEIHAYVHCLSCDSLRGKKLDSIKKLLQGVTRELVWRRPSVLLLDDIDHLVPTTPAEAEKTPDANYSLQMSLLLKDCLTRLCQNNSDDALSTDMYMPMKRICVIATAAFQHSLQPCLLPSSGCHLFSKIVNISLPDLHERNILIRTLINKQSDVALRSTFLDALEVARKTEGYSAHDFVRLSKIVLHNSLRRVGGDIAELSEVMTEDYLQAQKGFVPISLQNAKLHDPEKLKWSDVGGMEDVKEKLKEIFIWPMKYKNLFKSSGINLHCGVLLYGPPGCGKTLIAGAVANECGLNFISVKGPELLNKYIGASEAAVRNIFAQASAAAPCILFFDEFDSIAPRRGHDSTGVTDRVVNQILTHLDGIESLVGVQVLAATNRPDLIDPALLRPGRLDIHLHCPLPNLEERIGILESLLRKAKTVDNISIEAVATRCENFTGADLQALMYDAQLTALHGHRFGNDCCEANDFEQNVSKLDPQQKSESLLSYGTFKDQVAAREIIESNGHRGDIFEASLIPDVENRLQDQSLKLMEPSDVQDVIYFSSVHNKSEANDVLPEFVSELAGEYTKAQQETSSESSQERNECRIVIKRCCINQALISSRPSIPPSERMRYENICLKFSGLFSSKKNTNDKDPMPFRQRTTLA